MEILALVLLGIGGGDVLRVLLPPRGGLLGAGVLWAAVLTAAVALPEQMLGGLPWWSALSAVLPGALWLAGMPREALVPASPAHGNGGRGPSPGYLVLAAAAAGLIAIAALALGEASGAATSGEFPSPAAYSPAFWLLAAGAAVFLTMSSNALVRAALDRNRGSRQLDGGHVLRAPQLKGGRWIGPLERLTLAALLLAGAYPVAAGLIAAKGIVRFPEIQADKEDGNKAEYFLVGSFVSWALAIAAAGVLRLALLTG
ncbi:hypothetical protein [Sediminivirga luteola]|uniref:hypothetical protein n=1 Tax=Sediminivirga luteola TaxID=1774748 RepID=UPI001F5992DE|nr:hypothetical protein [Sediminivirga luteola]MCI2266348.1 hypothetical protein [Sediminivirga luteola]